MLKYTFNHDLIGVFFKYYNPAERFEEVGGSSWRDNWSFSSGLSQYRIEKWLPNKNLQMTTYFKFDRWFKMKIINEDLGFAKIVNLLQDWRKQIESGVVPSEVHYSMTNTQEKFSELFKRLNPGEREQWVQKWGSKQYDVI